MNTIIMVIALVSVSNYSSSPEIKTLEFSSMAACEQARVKMIEAISTPLDSLSGIAVCLDKQEN